MKRFLCYTDPLLFSLFGGVIIGGAIGSIISLASTTSLNPRWYYYVFGLLILTVSGWYFTLLSVDLAAIKIMVDGAPDAIITSIGKEKLIDAQYKKNQKTLIYKFLFAVFGLALGIVLIFLGPIFIDIQNKIEHIVALVIANS